jgi:hypothetical protein
MGLKAAASHDRLLSNLALLIFAALLLVVGRHHEPWFDEAQAWLIARESTPWSLITQGVRYEGTPALWHLLLWAVQRLGLPYGGLWLVSSALACAGAWIVLNKSPFPLLLRIGLIFSYFFAYQYSVVARSYALDLLFLPLLAWLFEARLSRPFAYATTLALIANTNAHSFVLSAVLGLEWLWAAREQLFRRNVHVAPAMLFFGLAALAAIFQAFPPKDINFTDPDPGHISLLHALALGTEAFIDRGDVWSLDAPGIVSRIIGAILTVLVLIPAVLLWTKAKRIFLAIGLFGGLIGFSALKYGNYWHAGIIFLTFVFCLWISWEKRLELAPWKRRWLTVALAGLLGVQVWCTAAAGVRDIVQVYSPARDVAATLSEPRRAHPQATLGVAGFKAFAIAPYFPINIISNYEGGAPRPAYYLWRRSEQPIPGLNETQWRQTVSAGYDRLLLSSYNLMGWNGPVRYSADAHAAGYCQTASFSGAMIWKTYVLESDQMTLFDRCTANKVGSHAP